MRNHDRAHARRSSNTTVAVVLALLTALGTAIAHPGRAAACGPTPPPYLTIGEITPGDGGELARDGAIRIQLVAWPGEGAGSEGLQVTVSRVSDGSQVPGQIDNWYADEQTVLVWAPEEPLAAQTQYRVEVVSAAEADPDIDGPIQASTTFTTTDTLVRPVVLEGALQVSLRSETLVEVQCENRNSCGGCIPGSERMIERAALFADVTVPRVTGGFDDYGYRAWLTLSDQAARVFDGPGEGIAPRGEETVNLPQFLRLAGDADDVEIVSVELPREDEPYAACFGFNAWDAAGHAHSAEPICVLAKELEAGFAALDRGDSDEPVTVAPGAPSAPPRTDPVADGTGAPAEHADADPVAGAGGGSMADNGGEAPAAAPMTATACALVAAGAEQGSALPALVLLLLGLAFARRQRP